MSDKPKDAQFKLSNVRLSFPDLFKAKSVKQDDEPKYGAAFLLDKEEHADQIKEIRELLWEMAMAGFGGKDKATELIQKGKLHMCLHEGSDKDYDGYDKTNMFISTSSKRRPQVIAPDRSPLVEEDGKPYAGCFVNAVVRFWIQDNNFGKRINAELLGVQFAKDGEPFGAAPLNVEDAFEDLTAKGDGKSGGKGDGKGKGTPDIPF
jgi:hypothetical protein